MRLLVTGGAGYIGSHMVNLLLQQNHEVTILDNLSLGCRTAITGNDLIIGDVGDAELLNRLFRAINFDAVLHFAASIDAAESILRPSKYYENNVIKTVTLLDAMVNHQVKYLVFSSSAAIYGEPFHMPIDEKHPKSPITPYASSKWLIEQMLPHYDKAYGLKSISLRYFNAAGADPQIKLNNHHDARLATTGLIAAVMQTASGRRPYVEVLGRDYATPDGTRIGDYVHVQDLCRAHLCALEHLRLKQLSGVYNIGSGIGYSVLDIISTAQKVTRRNISIKNGARRKGDFPCLVVNPELAHQELNWRPQLTNLETIIEHEWLREEQCCERLVYRLAA